jgi:hypothetical protein
MYVSKYVCVCVRIYIYTVCMSHNYAVTSPGHTVANTQHNVSSESSRVSHTCGSLFGIHATLLKLPMKARRRLTTPLERCFAGATVDPLWVSLLVLCCILSYKMTSLRSWRRGMKESPGWWGVELRVRRVGERPPVCFDPWTLPCSWSSSVGGACVLSSLRSVVLLPSMACIRVLTSRWAHPSQKSQLMNATLDEWRYTAKLIDRTTSYG